MDFNTGEITNSHGGSEPLSPAQRKDARRHNTHTNNFKKRMAAHPIKGFGTHQRENYNQAIGLVASIRNVQQDLFFDQLHTQPESDTSFHNTNGKSDKTFTPTDSLLERLDDLKFDEKLQSLSNLATEVKNNYHQSQL